VAEVLEQAAETAPANTREQFAAQVSRLRSRMKDVDTRLRTMRNDLRWLAKSADPGTRDGENIREMLEEVERRMGRSIYMADVLDRQDEVLAREGVLSHLDPANDQDLRSRACRRRAGRRAGADRGDLPGPGSRQSRSHPLNQDLYPLLAGLPGHRGDGVAQAQVTVAAFR
jgi:hypothetical protein